MQAEQEEIANTITHALGLVLSLLGIGPMVMHAAAGGDLGALVGCTVFVTTMTAVYGASTLSHLVREPRRRRMFRILDQSLIYVMISGTYTPFGLTYLRGGRWWLLLAGMWVVTLAGVVSKTWLRHRVDAATAWTYVLLGWMPLLALKPILAIVPSALLLWTLAGGVLYTLGTVFLMLDVRVRYFHAIWHLMVIAASAVHYFAIYRFVAPFTEL